MTKAPLVSTAALSITLILLGATNAHSELTQKGDLFVSFTGGIAPKALPRTKPAPVAVHIDAKVGTLAANGAPPPTLRRIAIALNRGGVLDTRGLPTCRASRIENTTTEVALGACRAALIGRGRLTAKVAYSALPPFPSRGRILAFNATRRRRPVILLHVYGTQPAPVTRVLIFALRRAQGTFGTTMTTTLPASAASGGYVKSIALTLHRRFAYRSRRRSYLSAACAAPPGFPAAVFPFARASFSFAGGRTLTSTITRSCRVRG